MTVIPEITFTPCPVPAAVLIPRRSARRNEMTRVLHHCLVCFVARLGCLCCDNLVYPSYRRTVFSDMSPGYLELIRNTLECYMSHRNFKNHWSFLFGVFGTCGIAKMRLLLLGRLFAHETYRLSESLVGKRAVASRGSVGAGVRGFLASGCVTSSLHI